MNFNHGEAFCLMQYASKDGKVKETIWNSRDGVTPFVVRSRCGQHEMMHVNWHQDRRAPDHKPAPDDRVFVDATETLVRSRLLSYIDKWWDATDVPMSATYASKGDAYAELITSWTKPGSPLVVTAQEAGL